MWVFVGLVALCVVMVTLRLCIGKSWGWPGGNGVTALWQIVSGRGLSGDSDQIITSLRMTRALTAAGTGAALKHQPNRCHTGVVHHQQRIWGQFCG